MNSFFNQPVRYKIWNSLRNSYCIYKFSDLFWRVFPGSQVFIFVEIYFTFELIFLTFFLLDKKNCDNNIRFMTQTDRDIKFFYLTSGLDRKSP